MRYLRETEEHLDKAEEFLSLAASLAFDDGATLRPLERIRENLTALRKRLRARAEA